MTKLYLDIDGVLLTTKNTVPAKNVIEFINFITSNFDCYWLTTHCNGNSQTAINYLGQYFNASILTKMEVIKPTNWITLKTEAIDFTSDFFWLDDFPFESEKNILEKNKTLNKLIIVDLNIPDELLRLIDFLKDSI